MGNKSNSPFFTESIVNRSYDKDGRDIDDGRDIPCKGDIVLFDEKVCLVIRANGLRSLSVIELPRARDGKYVLPLKEPIYNNLNHRVYLTNFEKQILIWRHPFDYLCWPLMRCARKLTWDQYKLFFRKNWPIIQDERENNRRIDFNRPLFEWDSSSGSSESKTFEIL